MLKNGIRMFPCLFPLIIVVFSTIVLINAKHLIIVRNNGNDDTKPLPSVIEGIAGTNLSLTCILKDAKMPEALSTYHLVWGRRTKDLRFKNESDLMKLAREGSKEIRKLQQGYNTATNSFTPLKVSDRGAYFCMNVVNIMFKIIHIKVKEFNEDNSLCSNEKFRCITSGICINLHYKCDGRRDCTDGTDEDWIACNGDPCEGKIHCQDGRCIPTTWCCNQHADDNCNVSIAARPSCCPVLLDPYDPANFYENQDKDLDSNKNTSSRYLFILICLISALLSFVLFLFIISKVCSLDTRPPRPTIMSNSPRNQMTSLTEIGSGCEHSECAIRREFTPNMSCLYRREPNDSQNSNNNEAVDPLIILTRGEISDQPPPYAEVVVTPPSSIIKSSLDDLINAPPPPYSTYYLDTADDTCRNNVRASDFTNNITNNYSSNQSTRCDTDINISNINHNQ